jgi:hypothetical protein
MEDQRGQVVRTEGNQSTVEKKEYALGHDWEGWKNVAGKRTKEPRGQQV